MKAEGSGFCPKRLKNVDAYLRRIVSESKVAGAGALIIRHGAEAYRSSAGYQDLEKEIPLKNDAIYRIYSMTKTFTVVAAMTLYEKGLFRLNQPVADFIPAFRDVKVAETDGAGATRLVPPKGPLTVEHLFTMTSGIPYPGDGTYSARAMKELNKRAARSAVRGRAWDTARMVEEVAEAVPLCFHPGERWLYGFSHDVLGRLIEVVSGIPLGDYFKEAIFEPLELKDTAFHVPLEKQKRVVKAYRRGSRELREVTDLSPDPASCLAPDFESGGGGLCSTLDDCARYALMLLQGGKLEGKRILSRKTLDLIRINHCEISKLAPSFFPHMTGYGYGLGVRTMMDTARAGLNGSPGEWAWDGLMGTYYCVDPAEDLAALFFIQLLSDINSDLQRGFIQTVYGAIDD